MKGSECRLVEYMDGSKKRFVIPVYQRNYDWKMENCKQLFDDLVKVVKNNRSSHFFGSIVSVYDPSGRNTEFLVIDGQQRLTTISLLMLAMYNLITEGKVIPETDYLSQQIYEDYLVDKYQPKETRIKLKPVKNDSNAFSKLFEGNEEHIADSNLTVNYNYFYSRIQKEEISVDELYDAICKLEVINITLNQDDNPQLIFESLNSTGLALSEGDKIRNFILMGLPNALQNDYYEKYWNKIELYTGYEVSLFVRDYLSIKQQSIPSMNRIYVNFKAYVEDNQVETKELLEDLKNYAKRYEILLKGNTSDKRLNACIHRLNRLETSVTRPFLLEVLKIHDNGKLSIEEVRDVFLTVENYLFRRVIVDLPTNALNKLFLSLHREIVRFDGTTDNYVAKFRYALLAKTERVRFPDDTEFIDAFSKRQVYLMYSKNKAYIFERLENFDTDEDKDIYRHIDDGDYTIEHIMPQHLTPSWASSLGEDYEEIHEIWLHRLANLTLTAYNSKYSNSDFTDKRDMEHGFEKSGLRMNTWIARQEKWTLTELEERNDILMDYALKIWTLPTTNYAPPEKQLETYTLDDDVNLNGREIAKFSFWETEQPVSSWIDMFSGILKILHNLDKSVLTQLAYDDGTDSDLGNYVSTDSSKLINSVQIDEGIYVEKHTSTQMKLSLLRRFFKAYHVDPDDLVFYLRDADDPTHENEIGTRYELRRKYWAFALEHIHEAHKDGGTFHNVHPAKDNWISGFVGINGVHISCVANYDQARIDFCLDSSNKNLNKERYEMLFSHKAEIEEKMGVELEWMRSNDTKASFIVYRLMGVSITDETDWLRMARFHAEWSKKFFDIIIPYLAG